MDLAEYYEHSYRNVMLTARERLSDIHKYFQEIHTLIFEDEIWRPLNKHYKWGG